MEGYGTAAAAAAEPPVPRRLAGWRAYSVLAVAGICAYAALAGPRAGSTRPFLASYSKGEDELSFGFTPRDGFDGYGLSPNTLILHTSQPAAGLFANAPAEPAPRAHYAAPAHLAPAQLSSPGHLSSATTVVTAGTRAPSGSELDQKIQAAQRRMDGAVAAGNTAVVESLRHGLDNLKAKREAERHGGAPTEWAEMAMAETAKSSLLPPSAPLPAASGGGGRGIPKTLEEKIHRAEEDMAKAKALGDQKRMDSLANGLSHLQGIAAQRAESGLPAVQLSTAQKADLLPVATADTTETYSLVAALVVPDDEKDEDGMLVVVPAAVDDVKAVLDDIARLTENTTGSANMAGIFANAVAHSNGTSAEITGDGAGGAEPVGEPGLEAYYPPYDPAMDPPAVGGWTVTTSTAGPPRCDDGIMNSNEDGVSGATESFAVVCTCARSSSALNFSLFVAGCFVRSSLAAFARCFLQDPKPHLSSNIPSLSQIDCGGGCDDACPTCNDGVQNGDEIGFSPDCGGSCPPCDIGGTTTTPSAVTPPPLPSGTTTTPTCQDQVQNGDESRVGRPRRPNAPHTLFRVSSVLRAFRFGH